MGRPASVASFFVRTPFSWRVFFLETCVPNGNKSNKIKCWFFKWKLLCHGKQRAVYYVHLHGTPIVRRHSQKGYNWTLKTYFFLFGWATNWSTTESAFGQFITFKMEAILWWANVINWSSPSCLIVCQNAGAVKATWRGPFLSSQTIS